MENTDKHWRAWGARDAFRGVCYPDGGDTPEFWQSGETYAGWLLENLGRLYPEARRGSVLDFGCGVGRILRPLSLHFERAYGVDVSEDMLAWARRNVPGAVLSEQIPGTPVFDLVHSFLVLQHIPVRRGLELVRRLRATLAPGGVLAVHAPIVWPHGFSYRLKHWAPALRYLLNPLQGKPAGEPLMQMNSYPVADLLAALECEDRFLIPTPAALLYCGRAPER